MRQSTKKANDNPGHTSPTARDKAQRIYQEPHEPEHKEANDRDSSRY